MANLKTFFILRFHKHKEIQLLTILRLQSWTKYLRQSPFFIRQSALREKFNSILNRFHFGSKARQ